MRTVSCMYDFLAMTVTTSIWWRFVSAGVRNVQVSKFLGESGELPSCYSKLAFYWPHSKIIRCDAKR